MALRATIRRLGGAINPPLVEALHADIREARTLLFVTTARPIQAR